MKKSEEALPLDQLADRLGKESLWLEQVARQRGLPSPEEVRGWLERFFGELSIRGQSLGTLAESQNHFVNWLKIQLEKKQYSTPKTPAYGIPKRIAASDFD